MIYKHLLFPLLSYSKPESIHEAVLTLWSRLSRSPWLLQGLASTMVYQHPALQVRLWDLNFSNPIGLAAGFDKNALALPGWPALGFGFIELGTVTSQGQPGNPKPRLFRLPQDRALINRMGFNNDGADVIHARLQAYRDRSCWPAIPIGINLGKAKVTPLEQAPADYAYTLQRLYDFGDYFVVNVSSPNTPGLRQLQKREHLAALLSLLQEDNNRHAQLRRIAPKPLLIKIAPDLSYPQIDAILALVNDFKVAGVIATNTTISRDGLKSPLQEAGGLSGWPLQKRSTAIIRYIRHTMGASLPIIGVGGIFGPEEAYEKIRAGANLVQIYTGLIYEGPGLVKRINRGLVQRLQRDRLTHLSEAVATG